MTATGLKTNRKPALGCGIRWPRLCGDGCARRIAGAAACATVHRVPNNCGVACPRRPNANCTNAACSGSCSRNASEARELDYVALIDCADAIGQGDASVAWTFANLASHHWMLAMFDERAQDAVWGKGPDALIASSFIFPAGRARKVDGGYVLRGSWPFSSGVNCSEWNMLASVVSSDDDADGIEYRIFLLPRATTIMDTWDATGLRGTGSNDVEVNDAFVAEP